MKLKILYTIIFLFLFNTVTYPATFYIDPTCATPGNGTSQTCAGAATDPFDQWSDVTWADGNSYLQKAGTNYHGQVTIGASGTSDNHIIIGRYGTGANPILTGINPDTNILDTSYGFLNSGKSYIDISYFDFTGFGKYPIYILANSSPNGHNTVDHINTYYNGYAGVMVQGVSATNKSTFNTISNSEFSYSLVGCMAGNTYVEDTTVSNSLTHDTWWHGFNSYSAIADTLKRITYINDTAHDVKACPPYWSAGQSYTVAQSMVMVAGSGSYICAQSHTSSAETSPELEGGASYWFLVNTFVGCQESSGFQFDGYSQDGLVENCKSYDNKGIDSEQASGRGFTANTSANSVTYKNNFAYGNKKAGIWLINTLGAAIVANNTLVGNGTNLLAMGDDYSSLVLKNNIIKNGTVGVALDSNTNLSEGYNDYYGNLTDVSGFTKDASDISANPLLINGFEISSNSPCKDTGADLSTELGCATCTDILNKTRPYNSLWDIGASEYTPLLISSGSLVGYCSGGTKLGN